MKLSITLVIASFGVIGVFSLGEIRGIGRAAGGLLDHRIREGLGGGGYHTRGSVLGLSRGIEVGRGYRYGGGEEEEERGGRGGGGGEEEEERGYGRLELRRGLGRGLEEEEEEEGRRGGGGGGGGGGGEEGRGRRGEEGEIGWGGSKFITPVDVHHEEVIHLKARPEFRYDYHVNDHKTKDFKSKHEVRDGYRVKGSYSLLEPDHKTIRVVDYTSDKKRGFVAKVTYRREHE